MAGTTHVLDAAADGLRLPLEFIESDRIVAVPRAGAASPELKAVFDEIRVSSRRRGGGGRKLPTMFRALWRHRRHAPFACASRPPEPIAC